MADPRTDTVRRGYDRLASSFLAWGARVEGDPRDRFVDEFAAMLPAGGTVLDLGCGVAALYSIAHVPREKHARLFAAIRRWLRPGGVFLASLGTGAIADWTGEWLGVPMFFSSHDAVTDQRLLAEAGLAVVRAEAVTMREPEGDATLLWVICRAARLGEPG